jgi:MFS transporter, CP family, cyanate transporter
VPAGEGSAPDAAPGGRPLAAGLVAAALVLRPQLTAVGPLMPRIQEDLGVGHAAAGLLATVPVFCMGLFGLAAARVLQRVGVRPAIGACLTVITLAALVRAVMPGFAGVLLLTLPFGIAAGVSGALFPAVVKSGFAARLAFGTALFAFALNVGASIGAGVSVPLADAAGSWRWSLGVLAAVGALAIPAWWRLSRQALDAEVPASAAGRLPWRSRFAWAAASVFAFQAICFFALNAWLADAMVERGWSDRRAGALVALLNVAPLAGVAVASVAASRVRIDAILGTAAAGLLAGTVALAVGVSGVWIWVGLISVSLGALFTLSMTLAALLARDAREAAATAGLQLGVGYTAAALAPLALGVLRDATGGFGAALWVVAAVAALVEGAVVVTARLLRETRASHSYYRTVRQVEDDGGGVG